MELPDLVPPKGGVGGRGAAVLPEEVTGEAIPSADSGFLEPGKDHIHFEGLLFEFLNQKRQEVDPDQLGMGAEREDRSDEVLIEDDRLVEVVVAAEVNEVPVPGQSREVVVQLVEGAQRHDVILEDGDVGSAFRSAWLVGGEDLLVEVDV